MHPQIQNDDLRRYDRRRLTEEDFAMGVYTISLEGKIQELLFRKVKMIF